MNRVFISSVLVALFLTTAGCKEKLTVNQMADEATRELGVVVMLWGTSDDVCMTRQMKSFYDEYTQATPARKKTLSDGLKKYSALILNASQSVGTIKRLVYRLELNATVCHQDSNCDDEVIDTREIPDGKSGASWQSSTGKFPGTRMEKGEQLMLTPVAAQDDSVTKTYSTYDRYLFAGAGSSEYADIETLINYRTITPVSEQKADPVNCGKLIMLREIQ